MNHPSVSETAKFALRCSLIEAAQESMSSGDVSAQTKAKIRKIFQYIVDMVFGESSNPIWIHTVRHATGNMINEYVEWSKKHVVYRNGHRCFKAMSQKCLDRLMSQTIEWIAPAVNM